MADEIRSKETDAKGIISATKAEAANLLAFARTSAEQSVKEARQRSHRSFREQVKQAEAEAEALAVDTVESGRGAADEFYSSKKPGIDGIADWLVKEVMSTYGNS
jgi:vacuolar-type H+-ATPase subunit H